MWGPVLGCTLRTAGGPIALLSSTKFAVILLQQQQEMTRRLKSKLNMSKSGLVRYLRILRSAPQSQRVQPRLQILGRLIFPRNALREDR